MPEIEIDPTTRIEGHHSTTLQVEDGQITEAKSHMDMFRGMELVVLDRPPSDAPTFTQRVCGVCFTIHRYTSLRAIETAARNAGVFGEIPPNAKRMRNLMESMFALWNHAVHLFALAGPDYSEAIMGEGGVERLNPLEGDGYLTALEMQRELLQGFAEFGGKAPHPLTYSPGGMAANPSLERIQNIRDQLRTVSDWLGPTEAVPDVIEDVQNGTVEADYAQGLHDIVAMLVAAKTTGADDFGVGPGRYYSNGKYYDLEGGKVMGGGIYVDGERQPKSKDEIVDAITEDVARSWFTDDSGGPPMDESPPKPDPEKDDAYSWAKAPRYNGMNMELGPLARLVIADSDPFDLRATLGGGPAESNTLNRLIARAQEALWLRDKAVEWLDEIDPNGKVGQPWTDDFSGEGVALSEASRGCISHWVRVEDGMIQNYQIITPTQWNLGPRDADGTPSIFEESVEGMEVADVENPINVLRTIRSFDPCLACSVHVESPESSYTEEITPAMPGSALACDTPYAGQRGDDP